MGTENKLMLVSTKERRKEGGRGKKKKNNACPQMRVLCRKDGMGREELLSIRVSTGGNDDIEQDFIRRRKVL